jgi:hypothetical protein
MAIENGDMVGILCLFMFVSAGFGAGLYMSALTDVEPMIPLQYKPPYLFWAPMEPFVWGRFSSRKARRKYVASLCFTSIFGGLIAIIEFLIGPRVAAVCGSIAIYCVAYTISRMWKYRELL